MNSCTHSWPDVELSSMINFNDINLSELLASAPSPSNYAPRENGGATPAASQRRRNSTGGPDETHMISKQPNQKQRKRLRNHAEKRRREKIQARFKCLRDAIPNCQKLDSASLLDKAVSHIKTLEWELHQMMQEVCPMIPFTYVPPYKLQFTGTTVMSPFPFVPPMRPNYVITSMNTNHPSVQPGLCVPFLPQNSAAVAGSSISAPTLSPNLYGCYDQSQWRAMPVHARNSLPENLPEENHRGK